MKKYLFLFLVCAFFISNIKAQSNRKVFVSMDSLSTRQQSLLTANKVPGVVILYQYDIDPERDMILNESLFVERIKRKIPSANATGLAIIDWEGGAEEILAGKKGQEKLDSLIIQFTNAIQIAKRLRPNVKWGFYGLPIKNSSNYSKEWQDASMKLLPLLKQADFLSPSLYMLSIRQDMGTNLVDQFLQGNLKVTLALANKLSIPVYPFIWHRWHPNSRFNSLALINDSLFKYYINEIYTFKYAGTSVSGVIWWDDPSWFYKQRKKEPFVDLEYSKVTDVPTYQYDVLNRYYQLIKK